MSDRRINLRLDNIEFSRIKEAIIEEFVKDFSKEEVKDAVWKPDGSKSLDPDEFNLNFIKQSWQILKVGRYHENNEKLP